jgi:16S rRNA (cytidine1402-2'-O)-methyltransferase
MSGTLYLCATPIGNLEDITFRVIRTLKEVDLIAAEDTRHSIKLLNHYEIKTPMTSYHEFNKVEKAKFLVERLLDGTNIALITDAGTPGISDPGEELVKQALEAGITVTGIPGACAAITALIMSGLSTRRFCFEAFLPYDKKERQQVLQELKDDTRTIILYEAPHKLCKTLQELYEVLGDRRLSIIKELTKLHETIWQTTLSEAVKTYREQEPKGEYVLVLEGRSNSELIAEKQEQWGAVALDEHMQVYLDQGLDKKEAMKAVAKDRGVSKRDIYQLLMKEGT